MREHKERGLRKMIAGSLCLLVLVTFLFSSFYLAAEAGHTCTGEDCPVCACLQRCARILDQIGGGVITLTAVSVPVILLLIADVFCSPEREQETPVLQKVRLNN